MSSSPHAIRRHSDHELCVFSSHGSKAAGLAFATVIWLSTFLLSSGFSGENENDEPQAVETRFSLADGLTVERVASPSLIKWPVVADWDADGNLVVVESGGVAWPIQQHNKQRLHKVVRLYDDDGDGTFDRRQVVAQDLPFAEGVLCIGNRLLVAAPPNIWELIDTDGDGFCEQRSVWFDGQTVTNCANDLHGPYLGRDSWIYWCKGAFAEQTHELTDGSVLRDRAAHIFRRRLEGGPIESVIAGGMDNPVELAFTPEGEKFFTSTFLVHPGNGQRDGIGHAVYGSVFGKPHDVIDDLTRTGSLMPVMTHLGPAAPSGLSFLRSRSIYDQVVPTTEQGPARALVSAQFNLHKIALHVLQAQSDKAELQTRDIALLTSEQVDFHPTDVLEDADGSLIVIDTGGWYDLCCPTSTVDQKVATGGIYRLKRAGADQVLTGVIDDIASRKAGDVIDSDLPPISDARPWIQRKALFSIRAAGNDYLPAIRQLIFDPKAGVEQRLDAIWALSWIGTDEAFATACEVFELASQSHQRTRLCQATAHVLGLHRYEAGRSVLEQAAQSSDPSLARAAVEALGRIGESTSVEPILDCLEEARESHLVTHSCIYALIEIGDAGMLAERLETSSSPIKTRALMIALDQLGSPDLPARRVVRASLDDNENLRSAALDILAKHDDWSSSAISGLEAWWGDGREEIGDQDRKYLDLVSALHGSEDIQKLVAEWASQATDGPTPALRSLLKLWSGRPIPSAWNAPLMSWLRTAPIETSELLSAVQLESPQADALINAIEREILASSDFQNQRYLLRLLPSNKQISEPKLANRLIDDGQYDLLLKLKLNALQARQLASHIDTADALQLPLIIESVSRTAIDDLDKRLLRRLYALPVARTLPKDFLPSLYGKRTPQLRQLAENTDAILQQTPKNLRESVRETLESLPEGDPIRGLQVFRNRLANCSTCHQLGYIGGNVGPELTKIGRTRTKEALLEAVLFPSARIEQSFRPTKILTTDGQIINGLIVSKRGERIELQTAADKRVAISTDEIELQEPSETSIMPGGMGDVLSPQQLADLLALLESAQ